MLIPSSVRLFVATEPTDMRKGHLSLAALVRSMVAEDPLSGHVFIFYNRRRNRLKALWWDRSGYALLYKRLERGSFAIPTAVDASGSVEIDSGDLHLLLEGIDPSAKRSKRWYRSPHKGLADRNTV